jgi:hypothetical protein
MANTLYSMGIIIHLTQSCTDFQEEETDTRLPDFQEETDTWLPDLFNEDED